ncbi:hypothetical protein EV421DRAFT_1910692 [Armillaria borealis]|uniref:Uncharacterized protein n=1 Tax=Armillaria borealis TaxID=47425 RepID=A0AA39J0U2_9AGAR|nr:hypothetical protein EV421DRAFT_1910692 [Armillaria borealis]
MSAPTRFNDEEMGYFKICIPGYQDARQGHISMVVFKAQVTEGYLDFYPFPFSEDDLDQYTPHERLARSAARMLQLRRDISDALEWLDSTLGPVSPSQLSQDSETLACHVCPRRLGSECPFASPVDETSDDDEHFPDSASEGEFSSGSEMDWSVEGDLMVQLIDDGPGEISELSLPILGVSSELADLPDLSFRSEGSSGITVFSLPLPFELDRAVLLDILTSMELEEVLQRIDAMNAAGEDGKKEDICDVFGMVGTINIKMGRVNPAV